MKIFGVHSASVFSKAVTGSITIVLIWITFVPIFSIVL